MNFSHDVRSVRRPSLRVVRWLRSVVYRYVPRRANEMRTCLDEVKAVQIAARFLKMQGTVDATNYTKLVKLLYLCDREALDIWNQPLTGDKYCWIKNGPVLSGVLDRIREKVAHKTYWSTCFRTVGYEITSQDGKKVFYTGDTGPGLSALWENVSPHLIIVEVTFPNKLENRAKNAAHLCPKMLKNELLELQRVKGDFPQIVIMHVSPRFEKEIKKEMQAVAQELQCPIDVASEGKIYNI